MDDFRVPVYVIMGLLESGKSSFINEILESGEFEDGTPGIVLTCEEGEVDISPSSAAKCGMAIENVDEEEQLTGEFFRNLENKYHPEKVFVEYNGMWDPDSIINADFPDGWQIYQVVTMIDASTFAVYIQNMRSIIGNIIKCTELAIFNRCSEDQDLPMFRRNIKATNPQIQIMFEHKDGRMIELGKDIPPYDLNAPVIEISDEDFGIWYMDAAEDRERYDGKVVHFKAKVMKNRKFQKGFQYFYRLTGPLSASQHLNTGVSGDHRHIKSALDAFNMYIKRTKNLPRKPGGDINICLNNCHKYYSALPSNSLSRR